MSRFRAMLGALTAGAWALLLAAGCPNANSSDLANLLAQFQNAAGTNAAESAAGGEEDVFRVLGEAVESAALENAPSADNEQPYFGEDPALYEKISPAAVELAENSVLEEAGQTAGAQTSKSLHDLVVSHGFVVGQFSNDVPDSDSDESGGVFRGSWYSWRGELLGVVRGQYEPLPPAELPSGLSGGGQFHGKFIDEQGQFQGFLYGRYGRTGNGRHLCFGHWLDENQNALGVLKGHWVDDPALDGGVIAGRWAAFDLCAETDSLPQMEFAADDFGGFDSSDVVLDPAEFVDPKQNAVASRRDNMDGSNVAADADDGEEAATCIDPNQPYGFLGGWTRPALTTGDGEAARGGEGGVLRGRWWNAQSDSHGFLIGRYEPYRKESETGDDDNEDGVSGNHDPRENDGANENNDADRSSDAARGGTLYATGANGGQSVAGGAGVATVERPPQRHREARPRGVFYGKVLDADGRFLGFVRGVYGRGAHGVPVFRGQYLGADGAQRGVLGGRWTERPWSRPGGHFFGVWNGAEFGGDSTEDDDGSDSSANDGAAGASGEQ